MPDAPEIPEAKDRFEKTVAITIAVVAVILSWMSNRGDDAKTSAIIKTLDLSQLRYNTFCDTLLQFYCC